MLIEEFDRHLHTGGRAAAAPLPVVARSGLHRSAAPIAIVGMEAHVGAADSLRAFEKLVLSGGSAIGPRPANRWRGCDELAAERFAGRTMPGAYIDALRVDAGEFHIPPSEIPEILPQQLLMLQVVARALDDAGMRSRERRLRIGVIIGTNLDLNTSNYHQRWVLLPRAREWARLLGLDLTEQQIAEWVASLRDEVGPALNANRVVGSLGSMVASRIAREFAFGGPSFAISAEEASGLRALDVGVGALRREELDAVVVGAVDLAGDVRAVLTTHALRPYSRRSQVSPFDGGADGTVVGEGAVALVLKRLPDALAGGGRVYALVRGLGFAGGDHPARPSRRTYQLALERAYAEASVEPRSLGYVEAHGSGVPREDRVEAQALAACFGAAGSPLPAIGSVKANIGHTGAAAGLASIVKTALCLQRRVIPPLSAPTERATDSARDSGVFCLPRLAQNWERNRADGPRRAGVSAIGLDGNCAHVVLEEAEPQAAAQPAAPRPSAKRGRQIVVPTGGPPPQPTLPQRPWRPAEAPRCRSERSGESARDGRESAIPCFAQDQTESRRGERLSVRRQEGDTPANGGQRPASLPDLAAVVAQAGVATARVQEAFLSFSQTAARGMEQTLALQARLLDALNAAPGARTVAETPEASPPRAGHTPPSNVAPDAGAGPEAYSRQQCLEFASGSVAKVLGPEFAEVDTYRARVRLPDEPLMLVDRILSISGEKGALGSGTIVTEHVVLPGAWYLDGGQAPVCIALEAGQADLFLCSYLGIDLVVKGARTYRLLDATVQFHRGLPRPGETIRYEITIDSFVRQAETYLFFFRFQATIGGQPLVTMTDGCAGFFTREEIEGSGGIVLTAEELAPQPGRRTADWRELAPMVVESYGQEELDALRAGDLEGCFGPRFAGLGLKDPLRVPGGRMRLVHRVVKLDPCGGRYGLGLIRAEADIHPDDWFLTCHFVDDMVMPGTLMYECCVQTLRILLLRMGWVGERAGVRCEPVAGIRSKLRCRGPVTPGTGVAAYEVQLKEIGYRPEPYVIADAFAYADGKRIVQFTDMSLRMSGLSREQVESLWSARRTGSAQCPARDGDWRSQ